MAGFLYFSFYNFFADFTLNSFQYKFLYKKLLNHVLINQEIGLNQY